ncbi:MAG: hypothetical protein JXR68_13135 [Bacteroidales bacterium]|nr:hypothetical protein [Bacteroidales bacterium]
MTFSQNNIGTSPFSVPGNIYHMGGNLGVGTEIPSAQIHILVDHNVSPDYPTIRLQNSFPKNFNENYWNITNQDKLFFNFSENNNLPKTKMIIDEQGRLILGTTVVEESSILSIESTEMGILIPRMTSLQIQNISAPANGLLVFDLDAQKFSYYDNNAGLWQILPTENDLSNYLLISEFETYPASNITSADISNWDLAYIWGNHAEQGYITASSSDYLTNKSGDISMWTNDVGYLTRIMH